MNAPFSPSVLSAFPQAKGGRASVACSFAQCQIRSATADRLPAARPLAMPVQGLPVRASNRLSVEHVISRDQRVGCWFGDLLMSFILGIHARGSYRLREGPNSPSCLDSQASSHVSFISSVS
jgi:hypothetical protein